MDSLSPIQPLLTNTVAGTLNSLRIGNASSTRHWYPSSKVMDTWTPLSGADVINSSNVQIFALLFNQYSCSWNASLEMERGPSPTAW